MTDYFIKDQHWSDVPPAALYVREVGYMSALKDEGVKIPPIKYVQETELLRARLRASAATEMLIYLLEGGEPDWESWNDRSESLCGYFKERFTETVPELRMKLTDTVTENATLELDIPVELEAERDYWKHQVELCFGYVAENMGVKFRPDILSYPRTAEQITPSEIVRAWMESHRTLMMAEGE